jgi:hypothetical protein
MGLSLLWCEYVVESVFVRFLCKVCPAISMVGFLFWVILVFLQKNVGIF